jgi:SagB-type dehydrogenase family enzyme
VQNQISGRGFLRSNWELRDESDQSRRVEVPPKQKPAPDDAVVIPLPREGFDGLSVVRVTDALLNRRSRRRYAPTPISLDEFSFLLFATEGVQEDLPAASRRPSPSAGGRHPFELYASVFRVDGMEAGLYRYLAFDHALCQLDSPRDLRAASDAALLGQGWKCALTLFWTAIPYRTEWRYTVKSPKLIALDAGHSCQNLYLACEAVGCGACAIGAYDQNLCDGLLGVDGTDELTVYAAVVGKLQAR